MCVRVCVCVCVRVFERKVCKISREGLQGRKNQRERDTQYERDSRLEREREREREREIKPVVSPSPPGGHFFNRSAGSPRSIVCEVELPDNQAPHDLYDDNKS